MDKQALNGVRCIMHRLKATVSKQLRLNIACWASRRTDSSSQPRPPANVAESAQTLAACGHLQITRKVHGQRWCKPSPAEEENGEDRHTLWQIPLR